MIYPVCDDGPEDDCACTCAPEFKLGDCASCHDSDVMLCMSDDEESPLHYVCKECFLRGL